MYARVPTMRARRLGSGKGCVGNRVFNDFRSWKSASMDVILRPVGAVSRCQLRVCLFQLLAVKNPPFSEQTPLPVSRYVVARTPSGEANHARPRRGILLFYVQWFLSPRVAAEDIGNSRLLIRKKQRVFFS